MPQFLPVKAVRIWQLSLGLAALGCAAAFLSMIAPARLVAAGGDAENLRDQIILWSCGASAANFVVLLLLLAICPWWAGRKAEEAPAWAASARAVPWFWPAVAGAALALMVMTLPRIGQSLWDDEETSVRFAVVGRYLRTPPEGNLHFRDASWAETLFYYKQPNNHVFHNVLARTSNSLWRRIANPQGLQFREEALRLPALIAGLAGIFALAWFLRSAGFPAAGVIAAWILALHPWYQRYVGEARGYSLVLALLPVAFVAWRQGLLTGRWFWWSLLGATQLALVWTYPAAVFVLLPLNLAVPLLAWRSGSAARPATVSIGRWFCCQTLAAVAALQLMAPLLPQARDYFRPLEVSPVGARWVLDYLAYLGAGLPWNPEMETPGFLHPRLEEYFAAAPLVWTMAIVTAIGLILAGAFLFLRRSDTAWKTALACGLAGPLLQLVYAVWTKLTVWEWYLLHALPWLAALAAVGLAGLAHLVRRSRLGSPGAVAFVVCLLAGYAMLTEPVRQWQSARPVTPTREAVLATRPNLDPHDPANKFIMTAGLTNPPAAYDANVFFVKDPAELILLCRMADASGRPLWLNIGHLWAMESDHTDTYHLVRDRRFFDQHQFLRGHTALGDRLVCRYIPRSLQPPAAAAYLAPEDELFISRNSSRTPEEYFSSNY